MTAYFFGPAYNLEEKRKHQQQKLFVIDCITKHYFKMFLGTMRLYFDHSSTEPVNGKRLEKQENLSEDISS